MWIVYIASVIAEKWAATRLKASTLNRDKFKIMKQRNWSCDISDAKHDFNFNPCFSLKKGINETVKAYLAEKKK
jgi:nucleoside-diphosphate-sugar epimerase